MELIFSLYIVLQKINILYFFKILNHSHCNFAFSYAKDLLFSILEDLFYT